MDERMRFVIRLKDGETMASLCREFGISRKTGYKIFERYEQCGWEGLSDRTRRPFRYANQLPEQVETAIVRAKREKPHWGARKIRERLLRSLPHAIKTPAASTIHAVLDRHGLVQPMGRRRHRAQGTPLSEGLHPNDLWCTDYKGEFQLRDKRYCYLDAGTPEKVIMEMAGWETNNMFKRYQITRLTDQERAMARLEALRAQADKSGEKAEILPEVDPDSGTQESGA